MKLGWIAILALAGSIFAGCTTLPPQSPPPSTPSLPTAASTPTTSVLIGAVTLTNENPVCDGGHPAVRLKWNAAPGSSVWYELNVMDSTGSGFGVGGDSLTGLTFYHEYRGGSGGQRIVAGSTYTYTLTAHNEGGQINSNTLTVAIPSSICTASRPPPRETGVQWDVASNVPQADLQSIRHGIAASGDFLTAHLGGDISPASRSTITIKVVATGRGNEAPGGGGACCTAIAPDPPYGPRPFFDVAHSQWSQPSSLWSPDIGNEASAAHEYAHAWQANLGCLGGQPFKSLGGWLEEGIAQQVSYAAMTEQGFIDKTTTAAFMESSAKDVGTQGKQWNTPLSEIDNSGVWPGHIGYLALDFAMNGTSNGLMGLRTICTEVAAGATREAAFKTAFGIELPEFYQKFEAWKASRGA